MKNLLKDVEIVITALEKYRYEKQITQKALAEKIGVSLTAVNNWFLRKRKPKKLILYRIQKLLEKEGFLK